LEILLRTLKNIGTVELDIVGKNKNRRNFAAAERTGQVFSDFSQVKKKNYDIVLMIPERSLYLNNVYHMLVLLGKSFSLEYHQKGKL